jgi:zinc transport system substrate-binding protein
MLILPIRVYQYIISPLTPAACRHIPTCSEYAAEALKQHGIVQGGRLAVNRILRCHPWGTSGFDPVPKLIIKNINMKKDYQTKQKPASRDRLRRKGTALAMLIGFLLFFGAGCTGEPAGDDRIKVLVSILPQKYFVEQIAGDLADVLVLIPPGTSPHAYDPTPRQMTAINNVDIYFYNGYLSFEQQLLNSLRNNNPGLKTVMLTAGVEMLAGHDCNHDDHDHDHDHDHHHHDGVDPHTWMSARNVKMKALNILKALMVQYPEHTDTFMENYGTFEARLNALNDEISEQLAGLDQRAFMIFHPVLGYFARDYNLEQLSIEYEGKEPTPAQLKRSIDVAREAGVRVIFIQQEFDTQNATLVAAEIGGEVVEIDPLAEQWYDNMRNIALEIKTSNR